MSFYTAFKSEIKTLGIVLVFTILIIAVGIFTYFLSIPRVTVNDDTITKPSSQPINTSTWQAYRNAEFGFELKYPGGWINIALTDVVGGNSFEFANSSQSVVVQVAMEGDFDLFQTLRDAEPGETIEKNLIYYTKISNESVAGYPAVRYTADYRNIPAGVLPRGEEVIMNKDGEIFSFTIWGSPPQTVHENQHVFNQILSMFRFVGNSNTVSVEGVTITTDKIVYLKGEVVKITVSNNLEEFILIPPLSIYSHPKAGMQK